MVEGPATLIGRSFSSGTVIGLPLWRMSYSNGPIFAVPEGEITFCWANAVMTSAADSPLDCSRPGSRLTLIWLCLPPYGIGRLPGDSAPAPRRHGAPADPQLRRLGRVGPP